MYFVYILRSLKDEKKYIGMTSNLDQRLHEHNSGKNKSTKNRHPFEVLYAEEFPDRITARHREKYFKSGWGRKWLKEKFNI